VARSRLANATGSKQYIQASTPSGAVQSGGNPAGQLAGSNRRRQSAMTPDHHDRDGDREPFVEQQEQQSTASPIFRFAPAEPHSEK
jgi:hypothetical protein